MDMYLEVTIMAELSEASRGDSIKIVMNIFKKG